MDLRALIAETRSMTEMAGGRPVAVIGRGLVVVGFGLTADAWEAEYQEYHAWLMNYLAENTTTAVNNSVNTSEINRQRRTNFSEDRSSSTKASRIIDF